MVLSLVARGAPCSLRGAASQPRSFFLPPGKYIPACGYTIFTRNAAIPEGGEGFINLKGISIGDGAMSPPDQFRNFGPLLYYIGMINAAEREVFETYETKYEGLLDSGDLVGAFEVFDEMLNGDFQVYPTYYNNVTGMTNYFNFEQGDDGSGKVDYYPDWLATTAGRNAVHVGDLPYDSFNQSVETFLKGDWMRGVVDMLTPLMDSNDVKVMVYSGQNDVILGAPLTEQFLQGLDWSGQSEFTEASKQVWRIEDAADPIAGYITRAPSKNFTYAVIRGAGHMVPGDQPQRSSDLIQRFVTDTWF